MKFGNFVHVFHLSKQNKWDSIYGKKNVTVYSSIILHIKLMTSKNVQIFIENEKKAGNCNSFYYWWDKCVWLSFFFNASKLSDILTSCWINWLNIHYYCIVGNIWWHIEHSYYHVVIPFSPNFQYASSNSKIFDFDEITPGQV